MIVAAFQAPMSAARSIAAAIGAIREQVRHCEARGVTVLCCPEAILGGLADDVPDPRAIAVSVGNGDLLSLLVPLASRTVTTVVGFTELSEDGRLFNAAAVFECGAIVSIYRKRHPARRSSVYAAGTTSPVAMAGEQRIGLMICNDTNYMDVADEVAAQRTQVVCVPSNNRLPVSVAEVGAETLAADRAIARRLRLPVVRADVAGREAGHLAVGTSAIMAPDGGVLAKAAREAPGLLVAELGLRGGLDLRDS